MAIDLGKNRFLPQGTCISSVARKNQLELSRLLSNGQSADTPYHSGKQDRVAHLLTGGNPYVFCTRVCVHPQLPTI